MHGEARLCIARRGEATHGMAGQGKVRLGEAGYGGAWQCWAMQGTEFYYVPKGASEVRHGQATLGGVWRGNARQAQAQQCVARCG